MLQVFRFDVSAEEICLVFFYYQIIFLRTVLRDIQTLGFRDLGF